MSHVTVVSVQSVHVTWGEGCRDELCQVKCVGEGAKCMNSPLTEGEGVGGAVGLAGTEAGALGGPGGYGGCRPLPQAQHVRSLRLRP